jgi:hypothetical protein
MVLTIELPKYFTICVLVMLFCKWEVHDIGSLAIPENFHISDNNCEMASDDHFDLYIVYFCHSPTQPQHELELDLIMEATLLYT